MNNKTFDDCLARVDAWATTRGLEVCRGFGFDAYFHEEKHVVYNTKLKSKKNQIYSLLHECGHALAFRSKGYKNCFPTLYKQRFGKGNQNKNKNVYKCETIAEEWDAWHRGYKLAKRLQVPIKKDDYFNYASRWVMTYVRNVAV